MPGATITDEAVLHKVEGGGSPPARRDGGDGGGDEHRPGVPRAPRSAYFTALGLGLASILMFFMALTSAFIVRKGLGGDWQPFELPRLLWLTTAVLIASSFTIEYARRRLARADISGFRLWWSITTLLGLLFLGGQYAAWLALRGQGVFLASNPSSSFFYVLTGAHGAHLVGGILALFYVSLRSWQGIAQRRATAADVTTVYWHFMDGLWVFLFLLLHLGR